MTTAIQIFSNDEFGDVRVVEINGEPWFVGKDMAVILGYSNPQKALRDHVSDKYKRTERIVHPQGGAQDTILISEAGLYRLVMRSNLPKAEEFSDWVRSEVLPTIRRTGSYSVRNEMNPIEAVEQIVKIAAEFQEAFAVKRGIALAEATEFVEINSNLNMSSIKKLLPPADHETGFMDATQIGKELGNFPPQAVNKLLANAGFQYKKDKCWRLTDEGSSYGEEMPFTRNGHSGYQIRWNRSVIKLIRDWM